MTQIKIERDATGKVTLQEVWIDPTENVFFTNLDPQEAHWPCVNPHAKSPDFCDNQLGPAPSPNSSQCPVPGSLIKNPNPPPDFVNMPAPYVFTYGCKFHPDEHGSINVLPQMAVPKQLEQANNQLPPATRDQGLPAPVQVVEGGKSPYAISGQTFQITDGTGQVIQSGSDSIGSVLELVPDQVNNNGIWVSGVPTVAGTYTFTFIADDGMGGNLQQVQYSMEVS